MTLQNNGTGVNSTVDLFVHVTNDTGIDNTTGCTDGCASVVKELDAVLPVVLQKLNEHLSQSPVKLPSLSGILGAKLAFFPAYLEVRLGLATEDRLSAWHQSLRGGIKDALAGPQVIKCPTIPKARPDGCI